MIYNYVQSDNISEKKERAKALAVRNAAMNTWSKTKDAKPSEDDLDENNDNVNTAKFKKAKRRRSSSDSGQYLREKSEQANNKSLR